MSTALVPVSQIETLPAAVQEQAVTAYLMASRDRLSEALEATGPGAVASIRAELIMIQTATKQLGLSKEIQRDAQEMCRRSEYTLGKAIRKGQAEGTVASTGATEFQGNQHERGGVRKANSTSPPSPHTFVNGSRRELSEVFYPLADDVTEEQFDTALNDARDEKDMSRANVKRKLGKAPKGETRDQRAEQIEALAAEGYTSHQIAPRVGVQDTRVRSIARDYDIDIPADRAVGGRRRLDSNRVLAGVAESVESAAYSLQQVNPLDIDQETAQEWVDSLIASLSALRKALNPIKESLHG